MSKIPYLKCGRITFDIEDGDIIMDNGACLQLITRFVGSGFHVYHPMVSKSEFRRFKSYSEVGVFPDHNYGDRVTLYRYTEM